jgi:hypothetical protein
LARVIEQRCAMLTLRASCPHLIAEGAGLAVEFSGYLPEFGSPRGLLIDVVTEPDYTPSEDHKRAAARAGIPVSFVNPVSWSSDASEFVAALRDWGYFGNPEDLPEALRAQLVPRSN